MKRVMLSGLRDGPEPTSPPPKVTRRPQSFLNRRKPIKRGKPATSRSPSTAREAVQTAEDARLITLKSQAEARLEQERTASAGREANANAKAADARADANEADRAAAAAQAQTERTKLEERRQHRAQRTKRRPLPNAPARMQRWQPSGGGRSESDAERTRIARTGGERQGDAAAAANLQALKTAAEKSEREKQELRSKLVTQLNLFLDTRDSARGLIVNMSDVLFDSGQFPQTGRPREAGEDLRHRPGIPDS